MHTKAMRTTVKRVLSVSMMVFELADFAVTLTPALELVTLPDAAAAWTFAAVVDAIAVADADVLTVRVAPLVLALEV